MAKKNKIAESTQKTPRPMLSPQDQEALFSACSTGDALALESLLQAHVATGASKLPKNQDGLTPLMLAAQQGHAECVKRLLPHSSVFKIHEGGNSALDFALFHNNHHGNNEAALILATAHQERPGKNGRTPLMRAACLDNVEDIRLLLPFFDPRAQDRKGRTALMVITEGAAPTAAREALSLLLPHSDIDAQDAKGRTALARAIGKDSQAIANALLDAGANAKLADHKGRTALMLFAASWKKNSLSEHEKDMAFLDRVYQASAPMATDAFGRNALIVAVKNKAAAPVVDFLAKRIDPLARDAAGLSAFDWALKKNHKAALDILAASASEQDIERFVIAQGHRAGPSMGARVEGFLIRSSLAANTQANLRASLDRQTPLDPPSPARSRKGKTRL